MRYAPYMLAVALLLAGCTSASNPQRYRLAPEFTSQHCPARGAIEVVLPSVAPGLDSAHIAVIDRPQHLSFYQDVAWSATLPLTLQAYFIDALERSHRFAGVSAAGDGAPAPWQLVIAVRNFEVDQSVGGRQLKVRLNATLRRTSDRQVVQRVPLDAQVDVSDASIEEIVQQFNQTLDAMTQRMLQKISGTKGCR